MKPPAEDQGRIKVGVIINWAFSKHEHGMNNGCVKGGEMNNKGKFDKGAMKNLAFELAGTRATADENKIIKDMVSLPIWRPQSVVETQWESLVDESKTASYPNTELVPIEANLNKLAERSAQANQRTDPLRRGYDKVVKEARENKVSPEIMSFFKDYP